VLEDYIRLFPDRPILPRVRSINILMLDANCLRYLIRSSTPAENQLSASASTLSRLSIHHTLGGGRLYEDGKGLARDVVAFQRSNHKLGGGLEAYQDFHPFEHPGYYRSFPPGFAFQAIMEDAFALPHSVTVDPAAHGLRRLEVTHYLRELPAFFGRIAKMRALEHLRIAIAHRGDMSEAEVKGEGIQHSISSLEIEGRWSDLCAAINLCPSPSAASKFRMLRLYYYLAGLPSTQAAVGQVLNLPAGNIPPDHLEVLTVELLDIGEHIRSHERGPALIVNEFQPLLRYRRMVKLHLDLPCHVLLHIEFLCALADVMGGTLRYLVALRAVTQWSGDRFRPVLTADDLPTIVGIMPLLETLGLDLRYNDISSSAKQNFSVASSLLRTLHVGTNFLWVPQIPQVAGFLRKHFPGLRCLYHHLVYHFGAPWPCVMKINGYCGGYYKPGGGY
jgi:hypothetical protein